MLIRIIQSIAYGKSSNKKSKLDFVPDYSLIDSKISVWSIGHTNPEHAAISRMRLKKLLALADELFSDNLILRRLFYGVCQGLEGRGLQHYADLSDKQMQTNMKTLRRHLARLKDQV